MILLLLLCTQHPLSLPPAYVLFCPCNRNPSFQNHFFFSPRAGCSTSPCSVQFSVDPEDVYIPLSLLFRLEWLLFRFLVVVEIVSLTRHPKGLQNSNFAILFVESLLCSSRPLSRPPLQSHLLSSWRWEQGEAAKQS